MESRPRAGAPLTEAQGRPETCLPGAAQAASCWPAEARSGARAILQSCRHPRRPRPVPPPPSWAGLQAASPPPAPLTCPPSTLAPSQHCPCHVRGDPGHRGPEAPAAAARPRALTRGQRAGCVQKPPSAPRPFPSSTPLVGTGAPRPLGHPQEHIPSQAFSVPEPFALCPCSVPDPALAPEGSLGRCGAGGRSSLVSFASRVTALAEPRCPHPAAAHCLLGVALGSHARWGLVVGGGHVPKAPRSWGSSGEVGAAAVPQAAVLCIRETGRLPCPGHGRLRKCLCGRCPEGSLPLSP